MAIKPVPICDKCGGERGVGAYTITYPDGEVWEVDLDEPHARAINELRQKEIGRVRRPERPRRRRVMQATNLADLV